MNCCTVLQRELSSFLQVYRSVNQSNTSIQTPFDKFAVHIEMIYTNSNLQIPLGVQLHNENKLDEMGKILEHFMTLVPTLPADGHKVLPNGSILEFDNTQFSQVLIGGDQLTAARIRGTQANRVTQDMPIDRLQGLLAVTEDWHSRMALIKVSLFKLNVEKSYSWGYKPISFCIQVRCS